MIKLKVNGQERQVDVAEDTPLLWVVRETLGLTGTKYGCGIDYCRACTVWIDGQAHTSCTETIESCAGKRITTIEGLSPTPGNPSHPVQLAWLACQVPQCGYCQSGMIMAVAGLLKSNPKPTDAQIDLAIRNICACGTYPRIRAAIKQMTGQ